MTSGRSGLSSFVALAYTLIIVYASLQPFAGWRAPAAEVMGFFKAPWPRYLSLGEVILNLAAYLPLGAMLYAALRARWSSLPAICLAVVLAALLSLAMESAQMFLPSRIASNVDLLANTCGAALGALAAWVSTWRAVAHSHLALLRRRVFRSDAVGDCGLIVVALWLVIQFHQAPLALGTGDLRDIFDIAPLIKHTPQIYLLAEAAAVAFSITAIGLILSLLTRPGHSPWPAIGITLALAFVVKSIGASAFAWSARSWQWVTPGVGVGMLVGLGLLTLAVRLGDKLRAILAVLCILSLTFVVNFAPDNPYQSTPTFMLWPQPTHLLNFSHIVHALALVWPLFAIALLVALAWVKRSDSGLKAP